MTPDPTPPRHRHPLLRGLGHVLGVTYLLVTLLFGPIQSLARWLAQQRWIQRYQRRVAGWSPAAGLALSLGSLGLLELAKLLVLLTYHWFGLLAAIAVTIATKASLGYFAHLTWQAARPQVIATYAWAARVDAWVSAQLAQLRRWRERWRDRLRRQSWYPDVVQALAGLRRQATRWARVLQRRWTTYFG